MNSRKSIIKSAVTGSKGPRYGGPKGGRPTTGAPLGGFGTHPSPRPGRKAAIKGNLKKATKGIKYL